MLSLRGSQRVTRVIDGWDGGRAEASAVTVGDTIYIAGGLTGTATSQAVGTLTAVVKAKSHA